MYLSDTQGIKANISATLLFTLCYFLTFPKTFLISDEWGYVGRAMSILSGDKSLIFTDSLNNYHQDLLKNLSYPLGTSYLATIPIFLFGKKMCFLVGLFSLLISQFLIVKMVLKRHFSSTVALITWCCLPCLVLSRTVMSDAPALLVSALFFYFYFTRLTNNQYYFLLGLIGGLSVLFRENLVALFGLFLLKLFYEGNFLSRITLVFGFSIGIFSRLLSASYFYNNPFFYKPPAPFDSSSLLYNILFYGCSLTLIYPLASLAIIRFKDKEALVVKLSILTYFLFFSFYAYNGLISGFLRSIILANRFFMPLLPLFMIAYAQTYQNLFVNQKRKIYNYLSIIACLMIVSTQITTRYFEQKNAEVIKCTENSATLIVSPKVTCAKYINLMTTTSHLIPTEACENNPAIISAIIKKEGYCDLFELTRSTGKNDSLLNFKELFTLQEICSFTTPEGFKGQVTRLK